MARKTKTVNWNSLLTLGLLVVVGFWWFSRGGSNPSTLAWQGIQVSDLDGNAVDLSQYEGQPLLLNFWGTWCGPCRAEMPSMERARQLLEADGIRFVVISDEAPSKLRAFRNQHDYKFEYLRLNQSMQSLDIRSIPQTFVINSDGQVVKSHTGTARWDRESMLEELRALR